VRDVAHGIHAQRNLGDRALAEVARVQWGVVSLAQLRALGFDRGAVAWRVRVGRLHPLHRGVYAVGHRRLTREGTYLAAVLACGEGAVLSHRSAAHHWGLLSSEATRVDVSVARARRQRAGIRLHRPRVLDAQDTSALRGIPITTVSRTLTDLPARNESAPSRRPSACAHGARSAFEGDRRRDAALTAAGYRVVRFAWSDVVEDGATVVRRLRALLGASSAAWDRG
jgi:hypothetical protein